MVELKGFEPLTSRMPCEHSSQLSYSPTVVHLTNANRVYVNSSKPSTYPHSDVVKRNLFWYNNMIN